MRMKAGVREESTDRQRKQKTNCMWSRTTLASEVDQGTSIREWMSAFKSKLRQ